MARLRDLSRLVRSKNAGPFELTFDIMFKSPEIFDQIENSGVLCARLFSELYGVPEELVRVYAYRPAYAYKITIPRPVVSGSVGDDDVYGCQQFGPLVDLEFPVEASVAGTP
ncbi:MAG: DUF4387 family protein [Streptosporangiales bacterium]|nr:DUF4387 family protein [Streptosporangiales bacterium]